MRNWTRFIAGLSWLSLSVASAATLSFDPVATSTTAGQTFSMDVTISGVTDLASFQFDTGFDPSILNAASISEGPFLETGGPTLFLPGTIDNTAGQISFTFDGLEGNVPGVTGSGVLATIEFTGVGPGTSAISAFSVTLLDSTLSGIPVETSAGQVTVTGTPEPVTAGLLAAGILALLAFRIRPSAHRKVAL